MGTMFAFVQASVHTNRAAKQLDHGRWFLMSQSSGGTAPQRAGFCHRIPRKATRVFCAPPNPETPEFAAALQTTLARNHAHGLTGDAILARLGERQLSLAMPVAKANLTHTSPRDSPSLA
jgi:hypothetical protein